MATINYDDGTVVTIPSTLTTNVTGHGKTKPVYSLGANKALKVISGTFVGDSSYPTNGEDITDVFNQFPGGLLALFIDSKPQTADTGKLASVDYTNKKLKLYTAFDTELGNTITWANTTIRFVAIGV